MKFKNLFSLAALSLMAAATLTSCEDILGEWSRPTPAAVTPSAIAVTGITLDADATINVGETKTLTATVAPDNATDKTVSWRSENETVATVADGVVTAVAAGTAVITATANDGSGVKATCTVTVKIPGLLSGVFTVNNSPLTKVQFSQGNLQYTISTGTWGFMEHQWTTVETDGGVGDNYASRDVVSLFGWGTSGYAHGATCYQPNSTVNTSANYYAYGDQSKNLYDGTGKADWGYNKILNGGNIENSGWRTLTSAEWTYLFNGRTSVTTCYCKATVNGVSGVVLFPDSYTQPDGVTAPASANTANADFSTNTWSSDDWSKMEEAGCVFLPAAGNRNGTSVNNAGSYGYYWSSSPHGSNASAAYYVFFYSGGLNPVNYNYRYVGASVRLVRPVE